jgi:hypothetical protein
MKLDAKYDTTLWGLLCVLGVVTVPVSVATWTIAQTVQSNELSSYQKAKEWGVKEAITKIETLSEKAALDAEERSEFVALRKQTEREKQTIEQLTTSHKKEIDSINAIQSNELTANKSKHAQEISELKQKLVMETRDLNASIQSLTAEREELKSALAAIVKDIEMIEIPEGEARFVVPGTLAVGVETAYGSFASISIGDRSITSVKAGNKIDVPLGKKKYVLTVMKITADSCTFAFNEGSSSD